MYYDATDFTVGDRIEAGAHTDTWMRGDRFGSVVNVGRTYIHVCMDRSERVVRFHPVNIGWRYTPAPDSDTHLLNIDKKV